MRYIHAGLDQTLLDLKMYSVLDPVVELYHLLVNTETKTKW